MRRLALALALLAWSGTAQAQDNRPDWEGVWEGTIGTHRVVACFDQLYDGGGQGSYYYLSQLTPIPLRSQMPDAQWGEGDAEGDPGSREVPGWQIANADRDALRGTWRAGEREFAIALSRVPANGRDYDGYCSSRAYFAARLAPPTFGLDARLLNGFPFVAQRYAPPRHFADVLIQGFRFTEEQPGDRAILAWLDNELPQGRYEDAFVQCLAGAVQSNGIDGFYEKVWLPDFANDELMAVLASQSTYCGGAHPNQTAIFTNFDRQSGALLDPADWFNERGAKVGEFGSLEMSAALREAVMASWTPTSDLEGEQSCKDIAADNPYWNYLLQAEGIVFQPDLPHVATACEDLIILPWDELQPFLSPAGKALGVRARR